MSRYSHAILKSRKEKDTLKHGYARMALVIFLLIEVLVVSPIPSTFSDVKATLHTSITHPTDDSWIELERPRCIHGTENKLHVAVSCQTVERSYLKFNLDFLSRNKGIVSAKLHLYCVETNPDCIIQIDVHETDDSWDENSISWLNAPSVGTLIASNTTVNKKNTFYSWDITSYAQIEHRRDQTLSVVVKLPADNKMIQDNSSRYERIFASKETQPKHKQPYLELVCKEVEAPVANFTFLPSRPVAYEPITFNASSSFDPDGHIISYMWDFGDSNTTTQTDPIITHLYRAPGTYETNLTVTDNDGLTGFFTTITAVCRPAVLQVSLPTGKVVGPNLDPWLNRGWLLNLTGPKLAFSVQVKPTSDIHPSYDTHLIMALDEAAHKNLVNLTIDGVTMLSPFFQYGTPEPYGIWTWPEAIYPTWFDDASLNLGTILPGTSKQVEVSAAFTGLDSVRIHVDAYGKVVSDTPTRVGHISWSPYTEDSTVLFTPRPTPLSLTITPTSSVISLGQSVMFSSSVLGGSPPYAYQWYLDDVAVPAATSASWTFTPTTIGHYSVYLNVTDSMSITAKSNIASVLVNPLLKASIIPASIVMNVGQTVTFTSSVLGGSPPYAYQWYLDDVAVPDATSS
ncbi:MAG: PKD domain-containing protein, partial [Candidatus Bathyarchaeota archaeon]